MQWAMSPWEGLKEGAIEARVWAKLRDRTVSWALWGRRRLILAGKRSGSLGWEKLFPEPGFIDRAALTF